MKMSNRRRRKRRSKGPAALAGATAREVVLAAAGDGEGVSVEAEAGIIRSVAVLTEGMAFPAEGEPFRIDATMLSQCAEAINAAPRGVKSRISHPELAGGAMWPGGDSIFHLVGRTRDARLSEGRAGAGGQVRADVHLGRYAEHSPSGRMRSYLLGLAEEDPAACGMSIRFLAGDYPVGEDGVPSGRIAAMMAVDFVGTPGGNPQGLLNGDETGHAGRGADAGGDNIGDLKVNKRQKAYLRACGLAKDADATQTQTFLSGLNAAQTEYFKSLAGDEPPATPPAEPPATPPATPAEATTPAEPAKAGALSGDAAAQAAETALAGDRQRRKAIMALSAGDSPAISVEVARTWADDGVSAEAATRLAKMAKDLTAAPTGRIGGGEDRNAATIGAISDALLLRAGAPLMTFDAVTGLAERDVEGRIVARKPHERALTMRRMPLAEMARAYLGAVGVGGEQLSNLSREDAVNLAAGRRAEFPQRLRAAGGSVELAMGTSDFPYILADALGKVFLGGYNLAPATWQLWCQRMTAPDFKQVKLLNLSEGPDLTARGEGEGITFGYLTESREVVALSEYTAGLVFTRRMMINDDLGVFRDGGASRLGGMAKYKEDDVAYAILTANAAMADTVALFHATHANLSAGASTAVYFACAPGVQATVVVLFLGSEQAPVLKQEIQWDTEDLKVAVRHSVAAKAADHRGLYKDVTGDCTVTSLGLVVEAMTSQTGPGGAFLNLRPAYCLCPSGSVEVAFAQLIGSSVDPAKYNSTPNPFLNKLTVIGDPRLKP